MNLRNYGTGFSIRGSKLESAPPSKEALRMIAELQEYVDNDDGAKGAPLCTVIHDGKVCVKTQGHE